MEDRVGIHVEPDITHFRQVIEDVHGAAAEINDKVPRRGADIGGNERAARAIRTEEPLKSPIDDGPSECPVETIMKSAATVV